MHRLPLREHRVVDLGERALMTAIMLAQSASAINQSILNLAAKTIADLETDPASAAASILFQSNGQISYVGNGAPAENPDLDEWVEDQAGFSDGADYEVAYTTLVSGSGPVSGPALGVYNALSANRTWSITQSGIGSSSGVWRFRVRRIANPNDFVEADMTVTATVTA